MINKEKPFRPKEYETKNHVYALIIAFLVVLCSVYVFCWKKQTQEVVKVLDRYSTNSNGKYEVTYGSVSTSGFAILNTKINNLRIRTIANKAEMVSTIKQVNIRRLMFTQNANIKFKDDVIETSIGDDQFDLQFSENMILNIFVNHNKTFNMDFSDNGMKVINKLNNQVISFENLFFKQVSVLSDDNILNVAYKVNCDKILLTPHEKNKKVLENNFEASLSVLSELDEENKKAVGLEITLEKLTFNDITNNFGIDVNGVALINLLTKKFNSDIKAKIINNISLTKSVNNPASEYIFFTREQLSSYIELLSFIPDSGRDTVFTKYYDIRFNSEGLNTINNKDIKTLIQEVFYNKQN